MSHPFSLFKLKMSFSAPRFSDLICRYRSSPASPLPELPLSTSAAVTMPTNKTFRRDWFVFLAVTPINILTKHLKFKTGTLPKIHIWSDLVCTIDTGSRPTPWSRGRVFNEMMTSRDLEREQTTHRDLGIQWCVGGVWQLSDSELYSSVSTCAGN